MSTKRDYKPDTTWKARRRVRRQGLFVIALALVGLLGSLVAYISEDSQNGQATFPSQSSSDDTATATAAKQTSPPEPARPKPKYDFYQVLSERELVIRGDELSNQAPAKVGKPIPSEQPEQPEQSAMATPAKPKPPPQPTRSKGAQRYVVQAGSFRRYTDADHRKASLAFLGIKAYIEVGTSNDGTRLHRVRIGPLANKQQADNLKQRLRANNIQAIALQSN